MREPEQRRDHGGRGHLHQHDVVQAHLVEAVLERDAALDLVRLDHRGEDIAHGERRAARGHVVARNPVGDREDAAQVVRRVAPFGREPGVVEVEPADHRADVECRLDRIELVGGPGHLRAVGHRRARNDRPQELGARRVLERLEAAAERVHQAIAGGLVGLLGRDLVLVDVVGDVDEDLVGIGADVADVR